MNEVSADKTPDSPNHLFLTVYLHTSTHFISHCICKYGIITNFHKSHVHSHSRKHSDPDRKLADQSLLA